MLLVLLLIMDNTMQLKGEAGVIKVNVLGGSLEMGLRVEVADLLDSSYDSSFVGAEMVLLRNARGGLVDDFTLESFSIQN